MVMKINMLVLLVDLLLVAHEANLLKKNYMILNY